MLTEMKDGEPGWIASLDGGLARVLAGHGTVVAIILAMLCTAAVLGIAAPPRLTRIGVIAAALAGLAIWILQDFGEIFTGQGTDPNSGLLLIAIAAAFWPFVPRAASS
jgi:Na+/melibiose symporter-like transporter